MKKKLYHTPLIGIEHLTGNTIMTVSAPVLGVGGSASELGEPGSIVAY